MSGFEARSLRELEARFIRLEMVAEREHLVDVDSIRQADGVIMLCPKCFDDPPVGRVGTHSILCWSPAISQDHDPKPGRWNLVGTTIDDLTLVAGSSSVLIQGGCCAHFFVRAGRAIPC